MTQLQDSDAVSSSNHDLTFERGQAAASGVSYTQLLVGIGLGLAIAFIGSRLFAGRADSTDQPATAIPEAPAQVSAQTVSVAPVQTGSVADRLTVTGTVQAADLLAVTPQIGGLQIRRVLVEAGDRVITGQPLVTLDDTELRTQIQQAEAEIDVAQAHVQQEVANLAQAEATLAEAEANLDRYQSLADQGAVSLEELDSRATQAMTRRESVGVAQADVASAEATVRSRQLELARLQTQLTYTTVNAPTDGIVAERPASVGDVSSLSNEVVSLIQNNQLELAVEVTQAQLPEVAVGAPVTITTSKDPTINLTGTVQEIQPLVDPESRNAQVLIRLPANERLRSGMFLIADIEAGQRSGQTIPAPALLPQPDGSLQVYVLSPEGTAVARTVEVGTRLSDKVEILQGLQPGEQVIVAGASFVQEGDVVTVAEE